VDKNFYRIISHRGYHGNGIIENTMPAFKKSIKNKLPIELDVYLTKDSKMVVFHDKSLKRLLGIDRNIEDCTYEELLGYSFLESDDKIPLFSDVLQLVSGSVPILIEVKRSAHYRKTCQALLKELENYHGKVHIQSFDFRIVRWFLKKKQYTTGLLVTPKMDIQATVYRKLVNSFVFVTKFIRPDFVSFDITGVPCSFVKKLRKANIPVNLWTIRNQKQMDKARRYGDYYIAEELGSFH